MLPQMIAVSNMVLAQLPGACQWKVQVRDAAQIPMGPWAAMVAALEVATELEPASLYVVEAMMTGATVHQRANHHLNRIYHSTLSPLNQKIHDHCASDLGGWV
mmetsp:Transcript_31828/g.83189  ORF Transcript_31828/g.83189 Transcript_31828/m.83189 type:complete len:103 (-) Transcript_31828:842-1150(-)